MTKYIHIRFMRNATIAVDLPSKEQLIRQISNFDREMMLNVGLSLCHPKDFFQKHIGRAIAVSKMQNELIRITEINLKPHCYCVTLLGHITDTKFSVKLVLSIAKNSNDVRILSGELL